MTPASALVSFQAMRVGKGERARYVNSEYGASDAGWILATIEERTVQDGIAHRLRLSFRGVARRLRPTSASGDGTLPAEPVLHGEVGH